MSNPIEAQSISSLTSLLANPPQYPRNPTHQPNEALVLYIVRVPGSKGESYRVSRLAASRLREDRCVSDAFEAAYEGIHQYRGSPVMSLLSPR
jgi:hypothetical protein